ncbi:MAG: Ig domain-containing protein [Chiayiivirga sp.]|jgi:hypothetical protein|nr:Ig domain-containing protein [Chiayiivirga sp.]
MRSRLARCLPLAAAFLTLPAQSADFTFYVGGTGRACDFTTIQAAIDAASADPADTTTIRLANDQTYTAQQLDIVGKNLRLVGGMTTCGAELDPTARTTLSGAGGARRSIINLRGSTRLVRFERLVLRDGDELLDNQSYGGALDVTEGPHASIQIANTQITNNSAGYGGAISLRWNDFEHQGQSFLRLLDNVAISSNRGSYGGGAIYCRNGWIDLVGAGSSVFQNTAGGSTEGGSPPSGGAYGGGLLLDQCVARIAAWGFVPAVWMNTATGPGGGIAAMNKHALVEVGNRDSLSVTRIAANHSDRFGGAFTIERGAQVYAYDAVIEENDATQGGGAVALYTDASGQAPRFVATSRFDPSIYRRACSSTVECNVIRGNTAYDGNTAKHGAAFRISTENGHAEVKLEGTRVSQNRGLSLVKRIPGSGNSTAGIISNGALIDRNEVTANLFDLGESFCRADISASTFADNTVGSAMFRLNGFYTNVPFSLRHSLVHQPGVPLISISMGSIPNGLVRYVIANDLTGVPTETGAGGLPLNLVGVPSFVDAANGNYSLTAGAEAVDYAPPEATDLTRDGGARDINTAVAERFGTQDLGAYERSSGPPDFYPDPPDGEVGVAYNHTLTANSDTLRVTFSADGLPPGLGLNPDSGAITPARPPPPGTTSSPCVRAMAPRRTRKPGSSPSFRPARSTASAAVRTRLSFTHAPETDLCLKGTATPVLGDGPWTWACAGIGGGTSADCYGSILNEPPYFISDNPPDGVVGQPYDFSLATDSYYQPVTYASFGLPPGLSLNSASGRISGVPTQAGTFYPVRIIANNEIGPRDKGLRDRHRQHRHER